MAPSLWIFPDLGPVLYATILFAALAFVPGYIAGWLANVFGFREGSAARRMALSVALSVSLMPVMVHLAWRFGGIATVWRMLAVAWAAFPLTLAADVWRAARGRLKGVWAGPLVRVGSIAAAAWMVVCLGSLLDLQVNQKRYFSVTSFDYMTRIPMASTIAETEHVPAENPYFNPGHFTPLRYHYFWPMICGLAAITDRAVDPSLSTRDALTAGTVWAGLAMLCVIALYIRFFSGLNGRDWKNYAVAFAMLGVTGLDIIPLLAHDSVTWARSHDINSTVEWWNEEITGWLDAMLWVPHHMVSLVCVLMVFLLLWGATEARGAVTRAAGIILAAAALASAAGCSLYVVIAFAAFYGVWMAFLGLHKEWGKAAVFLAAGVLALVLAAPFLRELTATGDPSANATGRFPVTPTVRGFGPVSWLGDALGKPAGMTWKLSSVALRLVLLPLNYFLELGFFFYVALIRWRKAKAAPEPVTRAEWAAWLMVASSVLVCTFLRSNVISSNDLGWRGFMITQFVLLLWAVSIWRERRKILSVGQRKFLTALLVIGVTTTSYDMLLLRGYMPALDARPDLLHHSADPDGQLGARTYALEQGYRWIRETTGPTAGIQPNPNSILNYQFGLYGERRAGVTVDCGGFSSRDRECHALQADIGQAFAAEAPADGLQTACSTKIDEVVVEDTDPVWRVKDSWVWRVTPVYANRFMRVFTCPR